MEQMSQPRQQFAEYDPHPLPSHKPNPAHNRTSTSYIGRMKSKRRKLYSPQSEITGVAESELFRDKRYMRYYKGPKSPGKGKGNKGYTMKNGARSGFLPGGMSHSS